MTFPYLEIILMSNIWRLVVKQIADSLIKTTNNKVILFTKELSELAQKLAKAGETERKINEEEQNQKQQLSSLENKEVQKNTNNVSHLNIRNNKVRSNSRYDEVDGEVTNLYSEANQQGLLERDDKINARISRLLKSIKESNSQASLLKRLENLYDYLKHNSDGIYFANVIGTQAELLKLKNKIRDTAINQVLNETLPLVGYCGPPASSGVRILSIDGGGMRGLVVVNILQQLELQSGKKIHQLFDYICGVSTGAIITCCSVPPITLPLGKLRSLYMELGRQIFKQNALKGAGKLVFSCAYYDTTVWEKLLKKYVGSYTLLQTNRFAQCPKICVLSTVGDRLRVVPFLFRNYSSPAQRIPDYPGSCTHTIFEALRASAAAPTVFEEFRTGEFSHLDGGIVANNPAGVAIHEVKSLWPDEPISCLVSCGTGSHLQSNESIPLSSWKMILNKVLESATDTESVHMILKDLLDKNVYHRFNPTLSNSFAIDEVRNNKIELLEEETEEYLMKNREKISIVANKLTEPRSITRKCRDLINMKIKLSTPLK